MPTSLSDTNNMEQVLNYKDNLYYNLYSPSMYRQEPVNFLFTEYVNKIGTGSVMESKLVRTIDKHRNIVRI